MSDPESQLLMEDFDGPVVTCWACNILVAVPLGSDGVAAPVFKCGWCGAVNDLQQRVEDKEVAAAHGLQPWQYLQQQQQGTYSLHLPSAHKQQHHSSVHKQRQSRLARHGSCLASACMTGCRWAVVALAVLLVASIAGTGIFLLLPQLCTTWSTYLPNLAVSIYLCISVAVNYTASVLQSPGRVSECVPLPPRGPHGQVLQGSYELFSFCKHCRAAKPPAVHHCSACRHCVVDMDHHCPFINNCVGRGNLRPFLLFLMWTMLSAAYVLTMCSILVWREWDVVRESAQIHSSLSHNSSTANSRSVGSSASNSTFSSLEGAAEDLVSSLAPSAAAAIRSSSSIHLAAAGRRTADAQWSDARLVASGGMLLLLLQLAPGWLLATYYLAAAAAALLLAVGALLASQLSYLGSGVTYIQFLKRSAGTAGAADSEDGAAAAVAGSLTRHEEQAIGDGARQLDSSGLVAAAGAEDAGATGEQQPNKKGLHRQPGKRRVLWSRVQEVLGVDSGSGCSLCRAVLVPRWQPVAPAGAAAAAKKWS